MKLTKISKNCYAVMILINARKGTLHLGSWLPEDVEEDEDDDEEDAEESSEEGNQGDSEDDMVPVERSVLANLRDVQEAYANLTLRLRCQGINPATRSVDEALFLMSNGTFPTDLLTPAQAAERLGVTEEVLARWRETRTRELKPFIFEDIIKYSNLELERFRKRHGKKLPIDD